MFWWVTLLIVTVAASIIIALIILPGLYLKPRYSITESKDRGIKKVMEKNGQSILFEPALKWRKYIKQYVLSERSEKKYLTCKIDSEIEYLSYEVALFNNRGEVFNVLTIKEKIEKAGYTKTVELPWETSYVAISVSEADTETFQSIQMQAIEKKRIRAFIFWSSLCILMETFLVKICCANIFGGLFREVFVLNWETTLATLLIAGILIVINWIFAAVTIKLQNKTENKV